MFKWLTDKFKKAGKHDDDSYPNIVQKSGYILLSGKPVEPDKVEHNWIYNGSCYVDDIYTVECTKCGKKAKQSAWVESISPPKYGCTG